MDHMGISGTEPSSVILSQRSRYDKGHFWPYTTNQFTHYSLMIYHMNKQNQTVLSLFVHLYPFGAKKAKTEQKPQIFGNI